MNINQASVEHMKASYYWDAQEDIYRTVNSWDTTTYWNTPCKCFIQIYCWGAVNVYKYKIKHTDLYNLKTV